MDILLKKYQSIQEAFNLDALKLYEAQAAWEEGDGSLISELPEDLKIEFLKQMPLVNTVVKTERGLIVDGGIYIVNTNLTKLPWKFYSVMGDFRCRNNKLITLEGAPEVVRGNFECPHNQLTTLEGAPKKVEGLFDCRHNQLTSLEGSPEKIKKSFDCQYNLLTTLEGAPSEIGGYFDCRYNHLISLEGGPKIVKGPFYCRDNPQRLQLPSWMAVWGNFYN